MDVTPASQPAPAGANPPPPARAGQSPAMISSDFETFLRMLTTQMQNQDPLNPLDSTDFAVQLATFSGVEQQVRTNQLLEGLTRQMNLTGMTQLAGWVGMEARVAAPVQFDGTPVTLYPEPASTAEEAVLVVRDASGKVVERVPVPLSGQPVAWPRQSGAAPAPGRYSFSLESLAHGDLIDTRDVEHYAQIAEARIRNGETVLLLQGGSEVPASSVKALRDPNI